MNMLTSCKVPIYLAYAMAAYSLASLFYMVSTRNVGTPLKDSYSKEQLTIKYKSKKVRGNIFYMSLLAAIVILFLVKPFHKCLPTE